MPYAERTRVPVGQTRAQIEDALKRAGAGRIATLREEGRAVIAFERQGLRYRITVPIPQLTAGQRVASRDEQERVIAAAERRRWRVLLLAVKAKVAAIEDGVETFEDSFLANVVLADGNTMSDHAQRGHVAIMAPGGPLRLPYHGGHA